MEKVKKVRIKCHCPCHTDENVKHTRECCIDGYTEFDIIEIDRKDVTVASDLEDDEELIISEEYDPDLHHMSQKEEVTHMLIREMLNKIDIFNSINTNDHITIEYFIDVLYDYNK